MKDVSKSSEVIEVDIDICVFHVYKVLDDLYLKKLVVLVSVM